MTTRRREPELVLALDLAKVDIVGQIVAVLNKTVTPHGIGAAARSPEVGAHQGRSHGALGLAVLASGQVAPAEAIHAQISLWII